MIEIMQKNPRAFIEGRQADWQKLEALLKQAESSARALDPSQLEALGQAYRQASSDLALAQRDFPEHPTRQYLNDLVARAHAYIYRSDPARIRFLIDFFRYGFPQLYRQILPYTILSFLLFLLPAIITFFLVRTDPDRIYGILGPNVEPMVSMVEEGEIWTKIEPSMRSSAASGIMTNNIRVTFLAFAGGMTAGILTTYVMLLNGLMLGAIFGLLAHHGMALKLTDFVLAHGAIELSVIFLAGGCGLFVADGILRPGLQSRTDVLAERARTAGMLILGGAALLVIAGLIEGFVSPAESIPFEVKMGVSLVTGIMLHAYWLRAGKHPDGPQWS